jgi:5-methylcytosine-specific restriction enzyme subunit McrC
MPTKIPIQNLYYLLAYAWDHYRSGEEIEVSDSQCPDVHNLLSMLLAGGIRRLATKGMDKGYKQFTETTPRLRGRVDVLTSHRRMTQVTGRMICEFDELTADTLPNQILKATCRRLLKLSSQLSNENRASVRHCVELLQDITDIQLSSTSFWRVQLHRNNRHYRLLIHVCRLLHDLYLPDQQTGNRRFRNVLEEEISMHRVFEAFVRRFAIKHCTDAKVSAMKITWDGYWEASDEARKVLPSMVTDVTLCRPLRKTILDCKFYKDALVTRHERHRLHSSHLYQLVAYLKNKSRDFGWENVDGILLYPAVDHKLDLTLSLLGHQVSIKSIDLDQEWPKIHERLLSILSI